LILKCQQHEATLTCTGARDYSEVYSVTETSEGIEERLCLKENECLNSNDGSLLKKYIDPNYKVVEANQESSPLWQKYAVLAGGAVLSIACTYKAYQSFQAFRREFSSETGTVARKALYATNTALWLVNAGVIAAAAVTFQREMSGQAVL
jgi:hypothetical protein